MRMPARPLAESGYPSRNLDTQGKERIARGARGLPAVTDRGGVACRLRGDGYVEVLHVRRLLEEGADNRFEFLE
jgi:hypothetical protein